jgi:hypothetical protein
MRARLLLCSLVAITVWFAGTAAEAAPPETIAVAVRFRDPGILTGLQAVRCGTQQAGGCELEVRGHSTVTGSWTGWTDYTMWAHGNPDGSKDYYTYETFTGTVDGCGRGRFDFVTEHGHVQSSPSVANPPGNDFVATWTIVPGSGSGGLARVSRGHGEQRGTTYPDTSSAGTMTGGLRCEPAGPSRASAR